MTQHNNEKHQELTQKVCKHIGVGYIYYEFKSEAFLIDYSIENIFKNILQQNEITPQVIIDQSLPECVDFISGIFTLPRSTKKPFCGELKLSSKDKEHKETWLFEISGTYENIGSDKPHMFATVRDVTKESKQIKDLQRNLEKAQNSDRIKTNFLLNISHNIRTPMNSILGFSELLSLSDPGMARRREYIQVIKKQSKSLLQLIDDVAEIAKFENGSVNISKSPVNINLLLKEVLKELENTRTESRKEHVKITLDIPSDKGYEIYTDAGRLHQVLTNITNHSLKNTSEGYINIGYHIPEDGKINFFVEDTSPGVNKEDLKYIFDQFTTISEDSSSRYSDESDLSLGISKLIVKLLGGKISAESIPGEGLTINFHIPYEEIPEHDYIDDNEEDIASKYNWSDKVILIVEDEDVNSLFLEAMFQDTNAQTILAKNGRQAVELCTSINKIDLVLMDIRMPVMNGILATQEIRKFNKSIPIIAQTALAHFEDRENCLVAGCNDFVTKPIEVESLLNILQQYLGE